MNRFFTKLRTDKPVTRNNYFMQIVRKADDPARLNSIDGDEMGECLPYPDDAKQKHNAN